MIEASHTKDNGAVICDLFDPLAYSVNFDEYKVVSQTRLIPKKVSESV